MLGAGARRRNPHESKRQRTEDDGVRALAYAAEIFKLLMSEFRVPSVFCRFYESSLRHKKHVEACLEAFHMAELAAEGCAHCRGILGWCYLHCIGVGVQYEGGWGGTEDEIVEKRQREKYCKEYGLQLGIESAAAGSAYGQLVAGDAYFYGIGGQVMNEVEAFQHYKLSADLGLAEAQYKLGCFYNSIEDGASNSESQEMYQVSCIDASPRAQTVIYLKLAAEQEHVDAQMLLADMYAAGHSGLQQDHDEAVRLYSLAAADGKRPLLFEKLGLSYMSGQGVTQDEQEAVRYFKMAIEAGQVETSYIHLARAYELGSGVPQDYAEARKLYDHVKNIGPWSTQWKFSKCAHRFQAYRHLAELNLVGKGGPQDIPSAIELLEHASQRGDVVSACILGNIYLKGLADVNPNFQQAAVYFNHALVSSSRFPLESDHQKHATCVFSSIHASKAIAKMLENGQGMEQNLPRAAKLYSRHYHHDCESAYRFARLKESWKLAQPEFDFIKVINMYRFAASDTAAPQLPQCELSPQYRLLSALLDEPEWSHAVAQCHLACLLRDNCHQGVTRNLAEVVELFQKAADQGHAEAIFHLACMYENTEGVLKDIPIAVELLRTAAEKGYADAQYRLACYGQHDGFGVDLKERVRLLKLAGEQGHAAALFEMACLYADGHGVDKCNRSALRYLKLTVAHGNKLNPQMQHRLASLFEAGRITQKDEATAAYWYSLAALKNFAAAQHALACMYYDGRGVAKDRREALRLFTLAANQEIADSQYRLACMLSTGRDCAYDADEATRFFKKAARNGQKNARVTLMAKRLNSNFFALGETTDLF